MIVNKYAKVTGGADTHCIELAEVLRRRGHLVRFVSTADAVNMETDGAFVGRSVAHESRGDLRWRAQAAVASRALFNPTVAAATRRLIREFRPDIVHTHKLYPQLSVAPLVVADQEEVPVVQRIHDYEFISAGTEDSTGAWRDRGEERASYRLLNTVSFRVKRRVHVPRVNAWIAPARCVAAKYARRGIRSDAVLPYFVPGTVGDHASCGERVGFVFLGRLVEAKGVRDILELARSCPDLEVTIAGSGPLSEDVERAAGSLRNLRYVGFVRQEDARLLAANARAVLVPSRWAEPGGIVALEAMRAGTPVVAYASGGLAEYVADSGAGILVPPDPVSLGAAARRLQLDERLWTALSVRGIEAVETRYSPDAYAEGLEAVCRRLVSAQNRIRT